MKKYANLIDGKLLKPASGKYFKNINPADRSDVIGLFPDSGSSDIKTAVEAARKAFVFWKDVPAPKEASWSIEARNCWQRTRRNLPR